MQLGQSSTSAILNLFLRRRQVSFSTLHFVHVFNEFDNSPPWAS